MNRFAPLLILLAAATAVAQTPPPRPPGPPRIDWIGELGITPEKAARVQAILTNEHEQHRAAHERARAELAKVLTADELSRFEERRPRPPRGPGPGPMGMPQGAR
jgi:hypothetical protein